MAVAIVKTNIPWGQSLAYSRGQRIDTDAVEANGWQEYVVGLNTREAAEIQAEITGRPVEDFQQTKTTTTSGAAAKKEG